MSLKLNAYGGGSVTLQEPTTASNYTLNLPAATGTVVYQDSSGSSVISSGTQGLVDIGSTSVGAARIFSDNSGSYFGSYNNLPMILRTNNTERARIDSSGNLLVGGTANTTGGRIYSEANSTNYYPLVTNNTNSTTTSQIQIDILRNSTRVGSISTTNVATSYNTSSDYRLKYDIAPMTGALAKVAALKPCTYRWKADGSDGEGFIAHELQAVVPQCVTGEKDAVDSEGNPVYQGIDTSFLVATLTAAIQELKAEVDLLRAQVEAK
jgi:hypothetical protein